MNKNKQLLLALLCCVSLNIQGAATPLAPMPSDLAPMSMAERLEQLRKSAGSDSFSQRKYKKTCKAAVVDGASALPLSPIATTPMGGSAEFTADTAADDASPADLAALQAEKYKFVGATSDLPSIMTIALTEMKAYKGLAKESASALEAATRDFGTKKDALKVAQDNFDAANASLQANVNQQSEVAGLHPLFKEKFASYASQVKELDAKVSEPFKAVIAAIAATKDEKLLATAIKSKHTTADRLPLQKAAKKLRQLARENDDLLSPEDLNGLASSDDEAPVTPGWGAALFGRK